MSDSPFDTDSLAWPVLAAAEDAWTESPEPVARTRPTQTDGNPGLQDLVEALPKLGSVLWLERRERRHATDEVKIGARGVLLLDHPALRTLASCRDVAACSTVTPHGPREWLCLRDGRGETRAKVYLLPDTDYLAWDELTARIAPAKCPPQVPAWHAHGAFLRSAFARFGASWNARLLAFERKRLPWMDTLDARPPLRLSLLGLDLAHAIARSEGAELVTPLYSV